MRKIEVLELKQIQLEILQIVADFCQENNINYWLDSGTLLGAIRHNGYIPWDDDIDLGMLRPDFDRFLSTFNKSGEKYKAYCIDNNPDFCYSYAKVLDTDTVLYEPDENGVKLSVYIDIFVYDNAPDDDRMIKRMFDARDFYRDTNILRTMNNTPSGNILRRSYIRALRMLLRPFPRNYFAKKMSENAQKYKDQDTERVGNFTSYTRAYHDKSAFSSFLNHEFEGKTYKIPVGYDSWLRTFYGDYMMLPPVEKRVSHHKYVAYINE